MFRYWYRYAALLLTCSLMLGCRFYPKEFREFRKLPREQRISAARDFPIEKQIDYHLLNMTIEPADHSLADVIAKQGSSALPALLNRMKGPMHDYQSVALFYVFRAMHERYLDLSHNAEVLMVLENALAEMKSGTWKDIAQHHFDAIRHKPLKAKNSSVRG